jgi:translation elongation factor EF-Ts
MGLRGAAKSDYHEAKYDFLWRAYEIAEAALSTITKPEHWQNRVAAKVATATGGALNESQLADLADLAMHVAADSNVVAYVSLPKKILRREHAKNTPASYAVFEFSDTGLQIEQYDDAKENRS